MKVPSGWEEWADYFDDRIEDEERRNVLRKILESGSAEGKRGEELGELMRILGTLRLHDMPEDLRDRLVARVRSEAGARAADSDMVERFLATLSFDSRLEKAGSQRSGVMEEARSLLFEAGPFEISLHVAQEGDSGHTIRGRLFHDDDEHVPGGVVTLRGADGEETAALDEDDAFAFALVPAGAYRIHVRRGPHQIEIEEIEIP